MSLDTERLDALAQAIVDGARVDWDALEASGPTVEGALLRDLQALSAVASRDSDLQPGDTWGGLVLQEEIGRGTYGVVYRAWDPGLEREVALKLFRGDRTLPGRGERAVPEGRLLAKVRHPNVVTVYGGDERERRLGLWTEFVKGKTLRDIVAEQGPMAADEAARIGIDLCHALAAVHAAGIVHGDVKAQNVMRETGGRIVLMDFGAGELIDAQTRGAAIVGTPAYLAPEVLNGESPTALSDIYAVGVLLFFLSTGVLPYGAPSMTGLRGAHALGRRKYLRDVRPDLPQWFIDVVDRSTAADAAERFPTFGEFDAAIRPIDTALEILPSRTGKWTRSKTVIAVAAIFLALGAVWVSRTTAATSTIVAIDAPQLTSQADGLGHVAKSLQSAIVARLGPARATIGAAKGAPRLAMNISDTEGRVAVDVQLIDKGVVRWTDRFERANRAAFTSDAAQGVAAAIAVWTDVSLLQRIRSGARSNTHAMNTYISGKAHLSLRTPEDMRRALLLFQEAVAAEPRFALAHAGVGEATYLRSVYRDAPRKSSLEGAALAARTALEIDPDLPEGYVTLGYVQKDSFDFAGADASFRRALSLNPRNVDAQLRLATVLLQQRKFDDAVAFAKMAIASDPSSIPAQAQYANILLFSRRYQEAIDQARAVDAKYPGRPGSWQVIGEANLFLGQYDAARSAFLQAQAIQESGAIDDTLLVDLAITDARSGNRSSAQRQVRRMEQQFASGSGVGTAGIAAVYVALGDHTRALEWLRRCVERKEPDLGYLDVHPQWDDVNRRTEFRELIRSFRP